MYLWAAGVFRWVDRAKVLQNSLFCSKGVPSTKLPGCALIDVYSFSEHFAQKAYREPPQGTISSYGSTPNCYIRSKTRTSDCRYQESAHRVVLPIHIFRLKSVLSPTEAGIVYIMQYSKPQDFDKKAYRPAVMCTAMKMFWHAYCENCTQAAGRAGFYSLTLYSNIWSRSWAARSNWRSAAACFISFSSFFTYSVSSFFVSSRGLLPLYSA